MGITETDKNFVAASYARFPIELKSGKGSLAYSADGKEYIDLGSGIAVNTFGYSDDRWTAAVTEQLSRLSHTSNLYYTEPAANLARLLCERTGLKKVFFSNSGAEANECAVKVARKYSFDKYGEGRHTIVTLRGSFHGRTITTLSATGQDSFHTLFSPFTEGFVYADADNAEDVKRLAQENNACAVMIELVQGEGGVRALGRDFVSEVFEFCRERDLLLICDEVQTGNGRTGSLYAFQQYGIMPDIVSTAKGLGGGLPIGATMMGERVENVLTPGTHGSTFGGNPVCAAGAFNVIGRLDEAFLSEVRRKSDMIFSQLRGADGVKNVTGLGLMIGIETEKDVRTVINDCRERGVLVLSAKNKLRLLPPLNIPDGLLMKAIGILKECLK